MKSDVQSERGGRELQTVLTPDMFICPRVGRLSGRVIDALLSGPRHAVVGVKGGVNLPAAATAAVQSADQY